MAERRSGRHGLFVRRALWGVVLPGAVLAALFAALASRRVLLAYPGAGGGAVVEGHGWLCAILMVLGILPALALVGLIEAWLRPLVVPEAIPNLGRSSGCVTTVVLGALLPLLAVAVPSCVRLVLGELAGLASARRAVTAKVPRQAPPVEVRAFQEGDIIYSQVDRNGLVTSISHLFRECGPDLGNADKPFIVLPRGRADGVIELYTLRNVGTGEVFEFRAVSVQELARAEWRITDEGQSWIKRVLEAKMHVQLARIEPQHPSGTRTPATSISDLPSAGRAGDPMPSGEREDPQGYEVPDTPSAGKRPRTWDDHAPVVKERGVVSVPLEATDSPTSGRVGVGVRDHVDPVTGQAGRGTRSATDIGAVVKERGIVTAPLDTAGPSALRDGWARAVEDPGAWTPSWTQKATRLGSDSRAFIVLDPDGKPTGAARTFRLKPHRGDAFVVYDWGAGTELVEAVRVVDEEGTEVVVTYVPVSRERQGLSTVGDPGWDHIRRRLRETMKARLRTVER